MATKKNPRGDVTQTETFFFSLTKNRPKSQCTVIAIKANIPERDFMFYRESKKYICG